MNGSYFAIECGELFIDNVILTDNNKEVIHESVMRMNADEFDTYDSKEDFVAEAYVAVKELYPDANDEIAITLIDDEGCFVWSVIMTKSDDNFITYELVDWTKDGKRFRYDD